MGWNLSQFHSETHSPPLICHPELASSVILSLSKDLPGGCLFCHPELVEGSHALLGPLDPSTSSG